MSMQLENRRRTSADRRLTPTTLETMIHAVGLIGLAVLVLIAGVIAGEGSYALGTLVPSPFARTWDSSASSCSYLQSASLESWPSGTRRTWS